ncbi:efflux RND transporter periplasmic adaptor subunit [bacterium]|nr:efflux RND transporter periplasmic adaptor subunit [bacterium]
MKRLTLLALLIAGILLISGLTGTQAATSETTPIEELRVCVMHPWEHADGEGTCSICGMEYSTVHNHKPGTPFPGVDKIFFDSDNPMWVHEGPGQSPDGNTLKPITDSPYYEEPEAETDDEPSMEMTDHDSAPAEPASSSTTQLWTCGMHPDVIQDEPGLCPICHMDLIPLKGSTAAGTGAQVQIDPVTRQNIGVKTTPVKRQTLRRIIRTNASVEVAEDREVRVTSRVNGYVETLRVARTGDPVRKGQTLLDIYSPELVTAQEELLLAKRTFDAAKGSGNETLVRSSSALLKAARKRLALWEISDKQIKQIETSGEVKRTLSIVSPSSGIVLHKAVTQGDAVKPGSPLFKVGNLGVVWAIAQVYEFEMPWVKEGDQVEMTSVYDPHLRLHGTVDFIYPVLDPKSRTANVRIKLDNPDESLKPDMWLEAKIESAPRENVLAIPMSAVVRSGKRDIVFIEVDEGLFEPKEVRLGVESDTQTEILKGVEEGDRVVVSAQFLLDSEAKLQEAIQRRIAERTKSSDDSSMSGMNQSGHAH